MRRARGRRRESRLRGLGKVGPLYRVDDGV